jgi:1,4-dihydroxy-2-naphthoate octaprenyltransferase
MFAPTHRIPIVIAAYRKAFVELAGQKADGYLARPAESIPSLRGIIERLHASAVAAGRDPGSLETAGYLLSLVDKTRREALNRAKREPFVIYMMSVLSDVSLARAGFDRDLRDRIATAWRAEDFTTAGNLIPDELLDAFMLCGTREDVAAGAMAFHAGTGLHLPLLQPVLQEDRQIDELIAAAAIYASIPDRASVAGPVVPAPTGVPAIGAVTGGAVAATAGPVTLSLADDRQLTGGERARRRAGALYEILRPFAFTASVIPVLAGAALAWVDELWAWAPFIAALLGAVFLHAGTNIVNEVYDVRKGVDTITSPRASHAIVKGRIRERTALLVAATFFALAVVVGLYLVWLRGPAIIVLGLLGLVGGWGYTAPPLEYKNRALGVPIVFFLMGPLMVEGAYFAVSGQWSATALVLSIPIGMLVAAILHGNEWRDIREDSRAGISTISARIGRRWAHYGYVGLVIGAYMVLAVAVIAAALPSWTLLAVLSLPFLVAVIRAAELGATGQARAIAMIDLETARLHLAFGSLLVLGLVLSRAVGG